MSFESTAPYPPTFGSIRLAVGPRPELLPVLNAAEALAPADRGVKRDHHSLVMVGRPVATDAASVRPMRVEALDELATAIPGQVCECAGTLAKVGH